MCYSLPRPARLRAPRRDVTTQPNCLVVLYGSGSQIAVDVNSDFREQLFSQNSESEGQRRRRESELTASRRGQDQRDRHRSAAIPHGQLSLEIAKRA